MDYQTNYQFGTQISPVFTDHILEQLKQKKVLDLGCGQGDYLVHFGPRSMGLDLAPRNLKAAKEKGLRVKPMDFNKTKKLNEKFEAVFASHVLEHVENPVNFLRFANQCLMDNGKLIITVPNEQGLIHWRYPYFTGDGNHLYSFTISNLKEIISHCGFECESIYYDFYTATTRNWGLNPAMKFLDYAPNWIQNKMAWAFWIVAKKVK